MSAALVTGVAVAGEVGAASRLVVDGELSSRWPSTFPRATLIINVIGSLVLGVLTGLVLFQHAPDAWRTVLGTGFCGGFTTFSTASFASVRLAQEGRYAFSALNVLGTLALSVAAACAGLALTAL